MRRPNAKVVLVTCCVLAALSWFVEIPGFQYAALHQGSVLGIAKLHPVTLSSNTALGPAAASLLEQNLAGKRFVYLAEPDHYISEKNDFLLVFIKRLVTLGYRDLGLEMSYADGLLLDRYLETGNEQYLNWIWSAGYRGMDYDLGDRTPRPKMFQLQNYNWLKDLQAERRWFFRQLYQISRSLQDGSRLKASGFDLQVIDPEVVYASIYRLLDPLAANPVIGSLYSNLRRIPGQSLTDELERLRWLKGTMADEMDIFISQMGAGAANELTELVTFLIESLDMFQIALESKSSKTIYRYLKKREQMMIARLHSIMRERTDATKYILSGHIMHLSKDDRELWFPSAKRPKAKQIWWTLGTELNNLYPKEVLGIWMLYDQGRHGDPRCEALSCEVKSVPDTLENLLGQSHREALLVMPPDLTGPNREKTHTRFKVNGETILQSRLGGQVDMIYFRRNVTEPNPNR